MLSPWGHTNLDTTVTELTYLLKRFYFNFKKIVLHLMVKCSAFYIHILQK